LPGPVEAGQAIDVVEFLWAGMALFDDEADTAPNYRPPLYLGLYSAAAVRTRILQLLADWPEGRPLDAFLPETDRATRSVLRQRSAWSSTLIASLEVARNGVLALDQDADWTPIRLIRREAGVPIADDSVLPV
jgi:segregation and condensation protein A